MESFVNEVRALHSEIEQHNIDDIKEHIQMYCKLDVLDIHRAYRDHILRLDNSDIIKQEIDCILSHLGIPYIKVPNE